MTEKQREIWTLYVHGHGPTAIARALNLKSRGGVSATIKKIKMEIQEPRAKENDSMPCPHSPSCFTCPLSDCRISENEAYLFNVI